MSNAIGQNATDLAVSGPDGGTVDLDALVAKVSARKAGGMTVEAANLDRNKVWTAVASEFKSLSNMERTARLPDEVVDRINGAIDRFRNNLLARFTVDVKSYRRFAAHKAKVKCYVMAETIRRESAMALKEQRTFAIFDRNRATAAMNKALDENRFEAAEKHKKRLAGIEDTLAHINASMAQITDEGK